MDQRLVPYIKKHLNDGHSITQIKEALLKEDIPEEDIIAAASIAIEHGKDELRKKISMLWMIPLLLMMTIAAVWHFMPTDIKEPLTPSVPCAYDCLAAAAYTCDPKIGEMTISIEREEISIRSDAIIDVRSDCSIYIDINDVNTEFIASRYVEALENDVSTKELDDKMHQVRADYSRTNIVCIFDQPQDAYSFIVSLQEDIDCSTGCRILDALGPSCSIDESASSL